jgi:uncharacterized protein involved in type VI secretion and phage assembly
MTSGGFLLAMSTTCAHLVQTVQQLAPEAALHETAGKNPENRFSAQMTASKAPIHAFEEYNENGQGPAQAVGGARFCLKRMESWRAKAHYLWRRALQPNQKDAEWVRLLQRLSAAYYVVRPLRLAWTTFRRLVR